MSRRHLFLLLSAAAVVTASAVLAHSEDDITFPIPELGNCQTETECKAYCDDTSHVDECLAFAEQHNLIPPDELTKAKKFRELGAAGPGGCASERECEAYCENINNIDECLAFAEQHGFMGEGELAEARKIAQALQSGAQLPGGCTSKAACEAYCSDANNMRECIAFAESAGLMPPEELKEAKQMLKALEAGVPLPGNCRGERECEAYCEQSQNMEECVNFALAAGFIPPEEADEVRRILPLMREGRMPGGCTSKAACEAYCSEEANVEECTSFFVEAGFMNPEEAEIFRRTGGRGPGGCTGERECEAFCNNPANQEACFAFAQEHGLIPEEDLAEIREGVARFKEGISSAPPEIAQCLREQIGQEVLGKIEAGTFLPNPELGEKMRACFEIQQQIIQDRIRAEEERFQERLEEFPEGFDEDMFPSEFEGQDPAEIERLMREQFEQQFQEQFEQQTPEGEFSPPEEFFPRGQQNAGFLFQAAQLFLLRFLNP